MLIDVEKSTLLVVDAQERLASALIDPEQTLENMAWLLRLARRFGVPIAASEQYPRGLGHTAQVLSDLLEPEEVFEKVCFSCFADDNFPSALKSLNHRQVIVCGMEAHVCVLQTAIDLKRHGKEVYVVEEAVSSRTTKSKTLGLERMSGQGIQIVNREMIAFEWLRKAGTDQFRQISKEFIK